jgi:hypothetical protein
MTLATTMNKHPLNNVLTVRVTSSTRRAFHAKAIKFGTPADILREIIEAFVEDRLTIAAPVTRKEKLYVNRTEN